jgi:imidazolonepropionase-like amidohydrolase
MTAGTDAHGACGAVPGFSLHSELVSLNRVGLPNAAVLQMATRTAAEWMGISTGRIAVGQRADLVLLRNNPLDEMAYTQHIEAVMTNGKWLDRATLDAMLAAVKTANARSRELPIAAFE